MSRSKKGSKGPGYDYWSRRPGSGMGHGPDVKEVTHRAERQEAKKAVVDGICQCKKPAIVTDETYCFRCHKPTRASLKESV